MLLLVSSGRGAQLHTRSASRALASRGANVVRSARQRMSERVGMMADDGASPGPRGVFRGVSDRSKPKRKVCVHVGFLGSNYHGMLYQESGIPTIERELFGALNLWGGISDDNADAPSKVGWQRASRTDKGVHAIGATVSLKLLLADEQLESQPSVDDPTAMLNCVKPQDIDELNKFLPEGTSTAASDRPPDRPTDCAPRALGSRMRSPCTCTCLCRHPRLEHPAHALWL